MKRSQFNRGKTEAQPISSGSVKGGHALGKEEATEPQTEPSADNLSNNTNCSKATFHAGGMSKVPPLLGPKVLKARRKSPRPPPRCLSPIPPPQHKALPATCFHTYQSRAQRAPTKGPRPSACKLQPGQSCCWRCLTEVERLPEEAGAALQHLGGLLTSSRSCIRLTCLADWQ